jgi:thiol:disulfide interchange protein
VTVFLFSLFSAFWLGVLTSISPCPLATNVAAVGFISRHFASPRRAFLTSVYYILGRAAAYLATAAVVIWGLLNIPALSMFLQKYMNKAMGPLLIIVGLHLFGLFSFKVPIGTVGEKLGEKLIKMGGIGGFFLGFFFALAFCPVSAALFFGSLIPLSVSNHSPIAHPLLYGVGTGLPVMAVAIVLVFAVNYANKVFLVIKNTEKAGKVITGGILVVLGIYFTLKYLFLWQALQF